MDHSSVGAPLVGALPDSPSPAGATEGQGHKPRSRGRASGLASGAAAVAPAGLGRFWGLMTRGRRACGAPDPGLHAVAPTFLTYVRPVQCTGWGYLREEADMGIRNSGLEELARLESKTLDARFLTAVQEGLDLAPFAAKAVLEVVKEVYFPLREAQGNQPTPGKVTLVAL